jgi:protoporphyrinogen oxidase
MSTHGGRIVVLGAGPCGLGAAHRLHALGHEDWTVYERGDHVGGLSASVVDGKGFTWDMGGHVLFSHYSYFDAAVDHALEGQYFEHLRESWIRILNRWVPYPFQNNIRHLPEEAMRECLEGLRDLPHGTERAQDFNQWMRSVFGDGIVKYFMEPYNAKVWGVPLSSMSASWIGERVSIVDRERIERNIAERKDDVSWGPNNLFRFPRRGGTGAIYEGISRPFRERITFHKEAVRVDLDRRTVTFADGETVAYASLINTSPLDLFIGACVDVPDPVRRAAEDLVHTGGLIVGLGISAVRSDPKCWMYFPESTSPFYRVTNFHNYSPHNVPRGEVDRYSSLLCETSYSGYKIVEKGTIIEDTVEGLLATGMIDEPEVPKIVSRFLIDIPYSYPVPTLSRDRALAVIQPFLEARGVYSRGRFGAWKYEAGNMDHSFMQGVEAVDGLLHGRSEPAVNGTGLS